MVWTIRFCSNLPAWGPNTYQIMYGETLDIQCQHQQWKHKIPDQNISFCSKFVIKTLSYYRC